MKRLAILLALLTMAATACAEETSETFTGTGTAIDTDATADPCPKPDETPRVGDEGIAVAGAKDAEPAITLPGGDQVCVFSVKDIIVGDGDVVPEGATIRAHYVGMSWKKNEVFDSSWDGDPLEFPLTEGVIPGWRFGLPGMKEGGRRLLIVPPEFGYGARPQPLAPFDTLVFVVDVLEVP